MQSIKTYYKSGPTGAGRICASWRRRTLSTPYEHAWTKDERHAYAYRAMIAKLIKLGELDANATPAHEVVS